MECPHIDKDGVKIDLKNLKNSVKAFQCSRKWKINRLRFSLPQIFSRKNLNFRMWRQRFRLDLCNVWCVKLRKIYQRSWPWSLQKFWSLCLHGLQRAFRVLVRDYPKNWWNAFKIFFILMRRMLKSDISICLECARMFPNIFWGKVQNFHIPQSFVYFGIEMMNARCAFLCHARRYRKVYEWNWFFTECL